MAYNCNLANMGMEFTFSTPLSVRTDVVNQAAEAMWTASTGSILRSSSSYTTSKLVTNSTSKRVSIVSPIKWDAHSRSTYCMERRRQFINTTISYCTLKQILRSLGYATSGGYDECVNRLLHSEWIPDRRYIEYDERLRARPVQHSKDRVVNLRCGELEYLSNFTLNELKRWLKHNNIAQPVRASKMAYMKIIQQHFSWRSPSPDSIRFKVRPKRPLCTENKTRTKSRTPKQASKLVKREGIMSMPIAMPMDMDSDSCQPDDCKMSEDSEEEEGDGEDEEDRDEEARRDAQDGDLEDHDIIPMQLCFDD